MSFAQPVIALLFCSSAKCHKSNDNSFTLCLVVNVQSVTSDYSVLSRMIKPGVLMCVCVCVCVRFCHTRSCIASRDPYCGWKPHGACERIQPGVL